MTSRRDSDCVVRPLRFTDDVAAMRAFLELLGMAPRVESERGGWVTMVAGAGMIALHDAATSDTGGVAGETRLSFECTDLEALAERLRDAGWADTAIWDEAYGQVLGVTDPAGARLLVNAYDDYYGFRVHDPARDARWSVVATRPAPDPQAYLRFLGCLGLDPDPAAPAALAGGHVGLVRVERGTEPVRLDFVTAEPLEDVAGRLRAAGHDAVAGPEAVTVTDPDGQPVTVSARRP